MYLFLCPSLIVTLVSWSGVTYLGLTILTISVQGPTVSCTKLVAHSLPWLTFLSRRGFICQLFALSCHIAPSCGDHILRKTFCFWKESNVELLSISLVTTPLTTKPDSYLSIFSLSCARVAWHLVPSKGSEISIRQHAYPSLHFLHKSNTRSSCRNWLQHNYCHTSVSRHFYFNCIVRLWNKLPSIDLSRSIPSIKYNLIFHLWEHFNIYFDPSNSCSYHYLCPCSSWFVQ